VKGAPSRRRRTATALAFPLALVFAWRLRSACRRQGKRAARVVAWLDGELGRIEDNARWLRGVDWDAIAASCGASALEALAGRLDSDIRRRSMRRLFLEALSTLSTYEEAWRLVLEFSPAGDRARLREIRALEDRVNAAISREFRLAGYFFRGLSTREFLDALYGRAGPGPRHPFVSMTTWPLLAWEYALRNQGKHTVPHAVAVIGAALARRLGAVPALYALAADALGLRPEEESAARAFPMANAREMQVHFGEMWPPGAGAALRAVAPAGDRAAGCPCRAGPARRRARRAAGPAVGVICRPRPPPRGMAEEAFAIRTAYDGDIRMTRGMMRASLDSLLPRGFKYAVRHLRGAGMYEEDYMEACRHFGLDHLLFDLSSDDILDALEARRARGAQPTARELPMMMLETGRKHADAMLDAYEARAADAGAMAARRAALRGARKGARRPTAAETVASLAAPPGHEGDTYEMHMADGGRVRVTQDAVRRLLGLTVPHGLAYLPYHLHWLGMGVDDVMEACELFGLAHLLLDVPIVEVLAELDARRARGAPPTRRELPLMVGEEEREYADAMLDVYGRKVAEAEARAGASLEVAPAAA